MKKILFSIITLILLTLPQLASAHILKTSGQIGAVLHIDPDDEPIINQPANFLFEIKDKVDQLTPTNCQCLVKISQEGKELFNQPLFQNTTNGLNATFSYTFTQKATYQLMITGQPLTEARFRPFNLTYDIDVERDAKPVPLWLKTHTIHFIGAIFIVLYAIILLILDKLNKKKAND